LQHDHPPGQQRDHAAKSLLRGRSILLSSRIAPIEEHECGSSRRKSPGIAPDRKTCSEVAASAAFCCTMAYASMTLFICESRSSSAPAGGGGAQHGGGRRNINPARSRDLNLDAGELPWFQHASVRPARCGESFSRYKPQPCALPARHPHSGTPRLALIGQLPRSRFAPPCCPAKALPPRAAARSECNRPVRR